MAELLEEWEIPRALVHGGYSSVLALEPPPDQDGWPLTLSAPAERQDPGPGRGAPEGLQRVGRAQGRPHPGPADRPPGAQPIGGLGDGPLGGRGACAAVADALSTAFMIQPAEEIADLCRKCPDLEAWLVPGPVEGGEKASVLVHLDASTT